MFVIVLFVIVLVWLWLWLCKLQGGQAARSPARLTQSRENDFLFSPPGGSLNHGLRLRAHKDHISFVKKQFR